MLETIFLDLFLSLFALSILFFTGALVYCCWLEIKWKLEDKSWAREDKLEYEQDRKIAKINSKKTW
jgi:hypothetical protein